MNFKNRQYEKFQYDLGVFILRKYFSVRKLYRLGQPYVYERFE